MFTNRLFPLASQASTLTVPLFLLTLSLLTACSPSKAKEAEVKNYTSASCPTGTDGRSNLKLTRNVLSLSSMYYVFNTVSSYVARPEFAEISLRGKYAIGKTEVLSESFKPEVVDRLRYDNLPSFNIRVASVLEMPQRVTEDQILKLSHPCQVNSALLDNEKLRDEPRGAFYILSSKRSFIVLRDGSYTPESDTQVRFKLFNPGTEQIEEATFALSEVVGSSDTNAGGNNGTGGDTARPPSTLLDQVQQQLQSWGGNSDTAKGNKEQQWSIQQQIKIPYTYFTVTKESEGKEPIVGEIISIEFVLK